MELPKNIYKYQRVNDYCLTGLKSGKVYFSKPINFNDPYDCAHGFDFELPEEAVEQYRQEQVKTAPDPSIRKEFSNIPLEILVHHVKEQGLQNIKREQEITYKARGVLSLAEENDNLLMWAHYADSFRGICLEFSTKYVPFNKIRPVRYTDDRPIFNLASLLQERDQTLEDDDEIYKIWGIKASTWSYEKEWRAIHVEGNILFSYPQKALTGIYFGPNIDDRMVEIICLIVQGNNQHTKFYRGELSTKKFEIHFKEFSYTPYIVAKEKGML